MNRTEERLYMSLKYGQIPERFTVEEYITFISRLPEDFKKKYGYVSPWRSSMGLILMPEMRVQGVGYGSSEFVENLVIDLFDYESANPKVK